MFRPTDEAMASQSRAAVAVPTMGQPSMASLLPPAARFDVLENCAYMHTPALSKLGRPSWGMLGVGGAAATDGGISAPDDVTAAAGDPVRTGNVFEKVRASPAQGVLSNEAKGLVGLPAPCCWG